MNPQDNRIASVSIDAEHIWLNLADGRKLSDTIKRHIRLKEATPQEREQWVLTDDDHGLNWPQLWPASPEGMVSAWNIEQDVLYDQAVNALQAVNWDTSKISRQQHDLVALWRMEADINNGGFMQFFTNWGDANYRTTVQALANIGAPATHALLLQMYAAIAAHESDASLQSLQDIYRVLTDKENEQLDALDEAFWDYPERLSRLVVLHYGPFVSNSQATVP